MRNDINKGVKRQRAAGIDLTEAKRVLNPETKKRTGKRNARRAQRRLDKALVQEQS